jgi:hypothetical protein
MKHYVSPEKPKEIEDPVEHKEIVYPEKKHLSAK